MKHPAALEDVRVLDLAGPPAWYATRLLNDLGADVLRIEPPGGDPARLLPPFAGDRPDPDGSLTFQWFNAGKRSARLDLDTSAGQAALRRLACDADLIVESFPVGWLGRRGVGFADLAAANPDLVMASVTPFGQTGPRSGWRGNDLVGVATGGLLQLGGWPDRPPSHPGGEQGYLHTGVIAAGASLLALYARDATGRGQQVDISLQDTVVFTLENGLGFNDLMGISRARMGPHSFSGGRYFYQTLDGWAVIGLGRRWGEMLAWFDEHGVDTSELRAAEWFDQQFRTIHLEEINSTIRSLAGRFPKDELMETAQRHHMAVSAVSTMDDLAVDPQLIARDFWVDVEQTEADGSDRTVRWPGAPFKLSETPWRIRGQAPRSADSGPAGWLERPEEHASARSGAPVTTANSGAPLAGIRVLDLTWVIAGPAATQVLADHGAEVLKIESTAHLDSLRNMPVPRSMLAEGPDRSGISITINSSKRSVSLNLSTERGREIFFDLIRISDVLVDNYGADPLPKWGLTPARLRELNPDLIIARSSVMGRSGPRAGYIGVGNTIGALAGVSMLSGFPGDAPVATCTAYPDYSSNPFHLLTAILAALHYRRRTGAGQTIDLAQHESTTVFNGASFLDYYRNGRPQTQSGNRHAAMAPHGVYRCRGEDRWAAIACESDGDWRLLAGIIDRHDLAADPRLETLDGRKANEDEIDAAIENWTRLREPWEVAEALQAAGVASGAVQTVDDLFRDPHLAARNRILRVNHPLLGWIRLNGPSFRLSETPGCIRRHPPLLGQDTHDTLIELLGLDERGVMEADAAGALR